MARVLFREEQRFTQWWLRAILLLSLLSVLVPFVYGIYIREVLHKPAGDNLMTTEGLISTGISTLIMVVIILMLFVYARLETQITTEYVMVAFPPFFRKWKKFSPAEIEKFEIRNYNAFREYGGYGLKRKFKYGQSFTISGKTGLQLYLKNGKKVLIGTQKKQAIEYAMGKLTGKQNSAKNG